MISDLAFEQISGKYYYAAYGPFRVIMDKSNGYINATKMCQSGGKDYFDWSRLKGSHQLIAAVENKLALEITQQTISNPSTTLLDAKPHICGLASPPCIFIQTTNNTEVDKLIRGTYCHPLLIPHIGSWISADFALKVSEVVNAYI